MRRDFGVNISESIVGKIMKKPIFSRSRRALRCKQKQRFKEHYSEIGKEAQIDHMTVTKNELKTLASTFTRTFIAKQIALMLLNF